MTTIFARAQRVVPVLVLALLMLVVGSLSNGAPQARAAAPRIVGGSPVDITAVPWQVLLRINDSVQCGGALIADTWILTAAHCMNAVSPGQVQAFVGVTDQNHLTRDHLVQVNQVIVNPSWNQTTYAGDLALIGLAAPVTTSASVQPVALPLVQNAATWPALGEAATISGWGTTTINGSSSSLLRAATVQILTGPGDAKCGEYGSGYVPGNHVCAGVPQGGVDACQGDSGGPLTVAYNGSAVLAGVVSSGSGCADPKFPGLYTRVTSFLPWLRQYVPLPQSPPGAPTAVTVKPLQGGRAYVSWAAPINDGGAEISFVATSSSDQRTCSSDSTSCVITGLTVGRGYAVTVTSSNSIGMSEPSAPSASFTAVSGTGRVGSTVRTSVVQRWAGRSAGVITVVTKAQCKATARGVLLVRPGNCAVKVSGSRTRVVILANS